MRRGARHVTSLIDESLTHFTVARTRTRHPSIQVYYSRVAHPPASRLVPSSLRASVHRDDVDEETSARDRTVTPRSSSSRSRTENPTPTRAESSSSARVNHHVGETGKRGGEIGDAVRDDGRVAVLVVRRYHRSIDRAYAARRRTRAARERDDDVEISGVFDGGESQEALFRFVSRFANEKD